MTIERKTYRVLSIVGTFKAARRGPGPLVRRMVRARSIGSFSRFMRKMLKP
jgi:hypothetical protein